MRWRSANLLEGAATASVLLCWACATGVVDAFVGYGGRAALVGRGAESSPLSVRCRGYYLLFVQSSSNSWWYDQQSFQRLMSSENLGDSVRGLFDMQNDAKASFRLSVLSRLADGRILRVAKWL